MEITWFYTIEVRGDVLPPPVELTLGRFSTKCKFFCDTVQCSEIIICASFCIPFVMAHFTLLFRRFFSSGGSFSSRSPPLVSFNSQRVFNSFSLFCRRLGFQTLSRRDRSPKWRPRKEYFWLYPRHINILRWIFRTFFVRPASFFTFEWLTAGSCKQSVLILGVESSPNLGEAAGVTNKWKHVKWWFFSGPVSASSCYIWKTASNSTTVRHVVDLIGCVWASLVEIQLTLRQVWV